MGTQPGVCPVLVPDSCRLCDGHGRLANDDWYEHQPPGERLLVSEEAGDVRVLGAGVRGPSRWRGGCHDHGPHLGLVSAQEQRRALQGVAREGRRPRDGARGNPGLPLRRQARAGLVGGVPGAHVQPLEDPPASPPRHAPGPAGACRRGTGRESQPAEGRGRRCRRRRRRARRPRGRRGRRGRPRLARLDLGQPRGGGAPRALAGGGHHGGLPRAAGRGRPGRGHPAALHVPRRGRRGIGALEQRGRRRAGLRRPCLGPRLLRLRVRGSGVGTQLPHRGAADLARRTALRERVPHLPRRCAAQAEQGVAAGGRERGGRGQAGEHEQPSPGIGDLRTGRHGDGRRASRSGAPQVRLFHDHAGGQGAAAQEVVRLRPVGALCHRPLLSSDRDCGHAHRRLRVVVGLHRRRLGQGLGLCEGDRLEVARPHRCVDGDVGSDGEERSFEGARRDPKVGRPARPLDVGVAVHSHGHCDGGRHEQRRGSPRSAYRSGLGQVHEPQIAQAPDDGSHARCLGGLRHAHGLRHTFDGHGSRGLHRERFSEVRHRDRRPLDHRHHGYHAQHLPARMTPASSAS
mmetsp:Transcript_16649/g.41923  ORF Transcript_16649/g.41923 Transcript_16649/m.41923 type:complete len:572 (+) Transcript_16649:451-2166(+)